MPALGGVGFGLRIEFPVSAGSGLAEKKFDADIDAIPVVSAERVPPVVMAVDVRGLGDWCCRVSRGDAM